jgi:hypothetical protein
MQAIQTLKFVKKEVPKWSAGSVDTPAGRVLKASTEWSWPDTWGMIKSRTGAFRMRYTVTPGLYAVGEPTKESDVFVTANYKLTFDILRRALKGLHAWILVLDTKSINVWCAAGKGTFGADELVNRISVVKLDTVVSHRMLILPQLGAVGVNASEVRKKTGFRISFGPVQARDIPAYIAAGYKKTGEMSAIKFPMLDRMVLTPMEINPAMKKFPWLAGAILLLFGLQPSGLLFKEAWFNGWPYLLLALTAVFSGAFLTPVLLPYVPFRSFAMKGWVMGLVSVFVATRYVDFFRLQDTILFIVAYLIFPALSSYLALQFTGATTFTGMSGVKKELKIGIPLYIGTAGISVLLVILFKLKEWRLL